MSSDFSYGESLTLFAQARRDLATAGTGAYSSTAPFLGVVLSLVVLGEIPPFQFWPALGLMAVDVWLLSSGRPMYQLSHTPDLL